MKLSVITVCKNAASTIEQTIQSVINQKSDKVEYIVIDGESTDGTMSIIGKYLDSMDVVVSEPDNGIYDAMNKGIDLATGDIISFINSDDWYAPNVLEKVIECFENSKADIIYTNFTEIEDGEYFYRRYDKFRLEKLRQMQPIPHPASFVKSRLYKENHFDTRYNISADCHFFWEMYNQGKKFQYLDVDASFYRKTGFSSVNLDKTLYQMREISLSLAEKYGYLTDDLNNQYDYCCYAAVDEMHHDELYETSAIQSWISDLKGREGDIVLFGAGHDSKNCLWYLKKAGIIPRMVCDNNKKLWGQEFHGIPIVNPNKLDDMSSFYCIISTKLIDHIQQIAKQVEEIAGAREGVHIETYYEWIEKAIKQRDQQMYATVNAGTDYLV